MNEHEIVICLGSSCFSRGNKYTLEIIKKYIKEHNLSAVVNYKGQLCSNNCGKGPVLLIDKQMYENITPENVTSLLDKIFFPKK
jgi:NADH:ubiquinone oxidoreductase subunit E